MVWFGCSLLALLCARNTTVKSQVRDETSRCNCTRATQEPPKIRVYTVHILRFEVSFLLSLRCTLHFSLIFFSYKGWSKMVCRPKHVGFLSNILSVFYVLLTVHLGSVLVNNQLDAQFFFRIYLSQFYTCFEHPYAHYQENHLY